MRGMRVSFAEAEAKVAAMPGVYECAARAVDHPEAGEALVLFMVPDPGASIAGGGNSPPPCPPIGRVDSIRLVSELPKTSAGKIARSSLAASGKELPCSHLKKK